MVDRKNIHLTGRIEYNDEKLSRCHYSIVIKETHTNQMIGSFMGLKW